MSCPDPAVVSFETSTHQVSVNPSTIKVEEASCTLTWNQEANASWTFSSISFAPSSAFEDITVTNTQITAKDIAKNHVKITYTICVAYEGKKYCTDPQIENEFTPSS